MSSAVVVAADVVVVAAVVEACDEVADEVVGDCAGGGLRDDCGDDVVATGFGLAMAANAGPTLQSSYVGPQTYSPIESSGKGESSK